ncbi:carboxypeptidase Q-like [Wyeomyia smithii]|uniref:carboxypeptidase Q-like n=1 Tax=Wyeomyia smithii TaxID=174621 RepID=UPI002467ADBF|nr:carboxypeptidase Q-like [Wyeomyia smithii]XP_055546820.1 carboxypeptidase Q-like [Wyeomyia smithii]XP_055546821.1 carboxypeptidase Q-like [Wyeomyia smithii]
MIVKSFIWLLLAIHSSFAGVHRDEHRKTELACTMDENLLQEIQGYQSVVEQIFYEIVRGRFAGQTWESIMELTDTFGPRMSGTEQLEKAIDYSVERMRRDGLENVHTEEALVPHWVRGYESAVLMEPFYKKLPMLGLGSSIGTPKGGIFANAVVVMSFEELESLSNEAVQGKIVVFVPKWVSYGVTGQYRREGAAAAAEKGAVAALIRSVTPFSIGSPHTGVQTYEAGVKQIPIAAITVEDAEMLLRKYRRGETLKLHIVMEDYNLDPFMSRNVIGELEGTVYSNMSVVVVSGHLDSWDVGVGAMDDAGGAMISWKALTYLRDMGLRPRRTIRAILWTGEEQGVWGAKHYYEDHKRQQEEEFSFFFEADSGTFNPTGFDFVGNNQAGCIFEEIVKLMAPLNITDFRTTPDAGPDISYWVTDGFPAAAFINDNERYFWFHHSEGDSMLVESSESLDKCAAIWAAAAYVVADMSIPMPRS